MKSNHDGQVLESLEDRLEKKQKQLELIDHQNQLGKRFHQFLGYQGVKLAEVSFQARRNQYRAILIFVGEADALAFYKVIEKEDRYISSKQRMILDAIEKNPRKLKKYARDVVVDEMDY